MELNTEWNSLVGEALDHFARLCVPKLNDPIEACTQELASIIREADIPDCFLVAHVSPHTFPVGHHVPNLACPIM